MRQLDSHSQPHYPHLPRIKLQGPTEQHLRQQEPLQVPTVEQEPMRYIALALLHLKDQIAAIANMTLDQSRPVDEYQPQEVLTESENVITLNPQWEVGERIESIIISGPAAAAVNLQLGDRNWNIVIPASGVFVVNGVSILLSRSDTRQLTATVPGNYTLELMGHADSRAQLI